MSIKMSDISSLVGRYNNSLVVEQANEQSKLIESGLLKKKIKPDKIGIVNIKAGENNATSFVADGGTLPTGSDVQPVQGTYSPVALFARISIPRIGAGVASSLEDGIDIVKEQMESAGRDLGRKLGRGVASSSIATVASTVTADVDTTFEVADPSGFRVGMAFEVYNSSTPVEGHTEALKLYVTNIAHSLTGGNATITFVGTGTAGAADVSWVIGYTVYTRGAKTNADGLMASFADATAAASLYGLSNSSREWSGTLDSSTTTLSLAALRRLHTTVRRRRGERCDAMIVNALNEERYSNLLINNRRFVSGKMDAVGGAAFEFEGMPVIADENFGDSDVFLANMKDVSLHCFREFAPDFDGGSKKGMDRGSVIVSDSTLTYDVQIWGAYNTRFERRNGFGRLSALTA